MERLEWWPELNGGPLWPEGRVESADLAAVGIPDPLALRLRTWNSKFDDSRLPLEGPGDEEWLGEGIALLAEVRRAVAGRYEVFVAEPFWGEPSEDLRRRKRLKHYQAQVDDVIIRLEPCRNRVNRAIHVLLAISVGAFFGDTWDLTQEPQDLVVRDRETFDVVFRQGAYRGDDGVEAVNEAARVIRTLGIDSYIRRERS